MSMFSKLKQFKDMRDQAKKMQGVLSKESTEGSAAFGKIKVMMDGNLQIISVHIDLELLSPDKQAKVQDGLKDACNDATKKIQRIMATKMRDMGGLDIFKK